MRETGGCRLAGGSLYMSRVDQLAAFLREVCVMDNFFDTLFDFFSVVFQSTAEEDHIVRAMRASDRGGI